jgi:hypothetical protein
MAALSPLDPYRWTLSEFAMRCEHGADIAEVVVEGDLDRDVVYDALRRWGAHDVTVFDADYIHIDTAEVEAAGFLTGVKGRLLTLAAALEDLRQASALRARVVIVADRDYDKHPPVTGGVVLLTDGHSMESYAFSARVIERFLRLSLGRGSLPRGARGVSATKRATRTGEEMVARVKPPAIDIAAIRLVLHRLEEPLGLFERWTDYVKVTPEGWMVADSSGLVMNVLGAAGRAGESGAVTAQLAGEAERVAADPVRWVRGHDFILLLLKLLRSTWGRPIAGARFSGSSGETVLIRSLMTCIDTACLDAYPLFRALRAHFVA